MSRSAFLSAALLVLVSCGESAGRPTTVTPTPQPVTSEISVGEITPGSGATLVFHECQTARLCTDQMQTTFDILVPTAIPDAVILVRLDSGGSPCAWAYVPATLPAGTRTQFKTSSLEMVNDEEGRLLCSMPTQTTRVVFEVYYKNVPAAPFLSRQLLYRYTLATQ